MSSAAKETELSRVRVRRRGRLLILIAVLGLTGVGLFLDSWGGLASARSTVRSRVAPNSAFGSQRLLNRLNRLGSIHPDFRRADLGGVLDNTRQQVATEEWTPSTYLYGLDRVPSEALPSSTIVPAEAVAGGLPILSLTMPQRHYEGLLANATKTGGRWERFGHLSYFDEGELLFASGVGIRIHGGLSRVTSPVKSFRIYFRDRFGASQLEPGILFEEASQPIRRLVVHNDIRFDNDGSVWHFIRPLGYDIAERFGVLVPETSPTWVYVNGRPLGVYVLTEYLDRYYLQAHYGHDRFSLLRERKNPWDRPLELGPERTYKEFRYWLSNLPRGVAMKRVGERVDLESLSRWFLAVLYCGATDSLQGPALLDRTRPDARWFWIMWDLDHAFKVDWMHRPGQQPWEVNVFRSIVRFSGRETNPFRKAPRAQLLDSLLWGEKYRRYLAELFQDAMNHDVTPEFLRQRYEHYVDLSARFGVDNPTFNEVVGPFLEKRGPVLWDQLSHYLQVGESHQVRVEASRQCPLVVDGRRKEATYEGRYYDRMRVAVRLDDACLPHFAHWQVSDTEEKSAKKRVRIHVRGDISIRPVLHQAASSSI